MSNPKTKDIDVKTQEGLELLKEKAKFYGHYAEQLKVLELIDEIENLKTQIESLGQLEQTQKSFLLWHASR